jgi:uncharacterized membrane protein
MDLDILSRSVLPIIFNKLFITGVVVTAGFALSRILLRREDSDSMATLNIQMRAVKRTVTAIILILTFLVPFIELYYQMDRHFGFSFVQMALATYITMHTAVLYLIFYRNQSYRNEIFTVFMVMAMGYSLIYTIISLSMRSITYLHNLYPSGYFAFHLLSLPAIALIIYGLARSVKNVKNWNYEFACWILIFISVVVLTTETSHAVVMLWGNASNYHSLLHDLHTFGFPILWGVLAMILMIWGLKGKEVVLRKISLFFFGVIILKFYAYDVWRMSQGGRIVSFVALGVILLLVSFMQQKIKTLVKDEKQILND